LDEEALEAALGWVRDMARIEGEKRLVGSRDVFYPTDNPTEDDHVGVLLIYGTRLKPYRSKCIHVVFRLLCYSG
jgi:hypothetical protein